MAIYHWSASIISKGKGQSAVASASYRSGEKLHQEATDESKFYKREVPPETMILAPGHAPSWVQDRNTLWNEVEKIEKHSKAQLSREINVALPIELSNDKQRDLIKNYVQEQFVDKGMVADIAIHRDDPNNPHCHIMLTMRPFQENGEWGNKKRKEYLLDKSGEKILDKKGKPKYKTHFTTDWDKKETLQNWREQWANHLNLALENEGINEKVSHLSNEQRGIEELPTIHLGHVAHQMEKKGIETTKGNFNREVEKNNETIRKINSKIVELKAYREATILLDKEKPRITKSASNITTDQLTKRMNVDELKAVGHAKEYFVKRNKSFSLQSIEERLKQLDNWANKVNKTEKVHYTKIAAIKEIDVVFQKISYQQVDIQNQKRIVDSIKPYQIMKLSEKRNAEKQIESHKKEIQKLTNDIQVLKGKYGIDFTNRNELPEIDLKAREEISKLQQQRGSLSRETESLEKARNVMQKAFVREVASMYPNNPEVALMPYKTVVNIHSINQASSQQLNLKVEDLEARRIAFNRKANQQEKSPFEDQEKAQRNRDIGGIFGDIIQAVSQAQQQLQNNQENQNQKQSAREKRKTKGQQEMEM